MYKERKGRLSRKQIHINPGCFFSPTFVTGGIKNDLLNHTGTKIMRFLFLRTEKNIISAGNEQNKYHAFNIMLIIKLCLDVSVQYCYSWYFVFVASQSFCCSSDRGVGVLYCQAVFRSDITSRPCVVQLPSETWCQTAVC